MHGLHCKGGFIIYVEKVGLEFKVFEIEAGDYSLKTGVVAILANGPTLNDWDLSKLDCDTIGINRSPDWIRSKYYVTVSRAFAAATEKGLITVDGAVFTNRDINEECKQSVVQVKQE